ncbi:MAG: hypothetical protein GX455_13300 [Phycisphaerae bacterium]|nr:hypothetical protein [Phycisphaerae bacterium]
MKRYRTLYCLVVVGLCSTLSFALPGSGTAEDPYRIQSMDDFDEFRNDSNFWNKHIRLECELDFSGRTFYAECVDYFEGVFDGNLQPIRNLRIDAGTREDIGFFGSLYSAQIRNMQFISPNVSGYKQVGILCGYSESSTIRDCTVIDMILFVHQYAGGIIGKDYGSTTTDCSVSGEITGYEDYGTESRNLGGLIGYTYDPTVVEDCHTQITIKKYMPTHKVSYLGGLIGDLGQGQVRRCSSTCSIAGRYYIGGLIGESVRPTNVVEDCSAEATLTGVDNLGGLIGRNGNADTTNNGGGSVVRCSAKASIQCNSYGGGLIGRNYKGSISRCGADSSVTGASFVGGLIGSGNGSIQDCYAAGTVDCSSMYFGGLIGTTGATIARCYAAVVLSGSTTGRGGLFGTLETAGNASSCFWNTQIQTATGINDIGNKKGTVTNIFGKITAEMKTQATFAAYGWDFTNETANGTADLWRLCTDGTAYPRLSWEFPRQDLACPDGVGVEDLLILSAQWLASGLTPNTGPDLTGDGKVMLDDLASFSSAWMTTP